MEETKNSHPRDFKESIVRPCQNLQSDFGLLNCELIVTLFEANQFMVYLDIQIHILHQIQEVFHPIVFSNIFSATFSFPLSSESLLCKEVSGSVYLCALFSSCSSNQINPTTHICRLFFLFAKMDSLNPCKEVHFSYCTFQLQKVYVFPFRHIHLLISISTSSCTVLQFSFCCFAHGKLDS